jgi:O-methyltransferase
VIAEAFDYMAAKSLDGCFCEFGVWQGAGLALIDRLARKLAGPHAKVFGFDSFEGMPKTAVDLHDNQAIVWAAGGYQSNIMDVAGRVPKAKLIKGIFSDLLPLAEYGIGKVRFASLDCDLYESYRDALRLLTPHLQVGTVLLFDEVIPTLDKRYHDSIRDSGQRAVDEWLEANQWKLKPLNIFNTAWLTEVYL